MKITDLVVRNKFTAKLTEVAERCFDTTFVLGIIFFEAVTGLREKNARYPNPWNNFS